MDGLCETLGNLSPPPLGGGTGKGGKTTQIANIHRNKLSEKDVVYLERRDPALLLPKNICEVIAH
jgi:hypothetical protein